jgi:uncharacterized protein
MILKSRQEIKWTDRLKSFFWPKKSYWRSLQYYGKRILRIRATPHALAAGFATGIFAAFSPALGIHILMALALSWIFGGNLIAAALGTTAANPLTFPLMITGELKLGRLFFGGDPATHVPLHKIGLMLTHFDFGGMWVPVFKPLLLGSVLLGVIFAIPVYFAIYYAAKSLADRRRIRMEQKAAAAEL